LTTISYKDGIVAYDSRCVGGQRIVDDNFDKKYLRDGLVGFFCGEVGKVEKLFDMYISECAYDEDEIDTDIEGLIVSKDGLKNVGLYEGRLVVCDMNPKRSYAFGSGGSYALTALDLGKTAAESVKMAAKRDVFTGGKIRTFKTVWATKTNAKR
jgi:ATP-dependent protease HslVU (ClpYQ) peptidase subunit